MEAMSAGVDISIFGTVRCCILLWRLFLVCLSGATLSKENSSQIDPFRSTFGLCEGCVAPAWIGTLPVHHRLALPVQQLAEIPPH